MNGLCDEFVEPVRNDCVFAFGSSWVEIGLGSTKMPLSLVKRTFCTNLYLGRINLVVPEPSSGSDTAIKL